MRRPVTLLAVLLAVLAAGCGADHRSSQEAYARHYTEVSAKLQQAFARIPASTGDTPLAQVADRLDQSAKALGDASKGFDEIEPPKASEASNAKLVKGLGDLAAIYRRGAAAARKGDHQGVTRTLQGLPKSKPFQAVAAAQRELAAQGVTPTATTGG